MAGKRRTKKILRLLLVCQRAKLSPVLVAVPKANWGPDGSCASLAAAAGSRPALPPGPERAQPDETSLGRSARSLMLYCAPVWIHDGCGGSGVGGREAASHAAGPSGAEKYPAGERLGACVVPVVGFGERERVNVCHCTPNVGPRYSAYRPPGACVFWN